MKKILLTTAIIVLGYGFGAAQSFYNIAPLLHCPKPDTFPWYLWGYSTACGDFNNDGDIEFVSYTALNWDWKKYYYESNPLDTIPEIVIDDSVGSGSPPALCSGDFNGDGITDLAICDPIGWDTLGRIDIYYGKVSFNMIPDTAIHGPVWGWGSEFGRALASGDVNGDGIDDIISGAYYGNGFVCIYYGDTLGIHTVPDIILHGQNKNEALGITLSSGADFNSDGYEDIAIGAWGNSESFGAAGKVYIFLGGNPMDTIPDAWTLGENIGANLGLFGVALVPNTNGSPAMGFWGTMLSPGPSATTTGKQYWVFGGSPVNGEADITRTGSYYDSGIGFGSDYAGDVDSNKYGDFISGAPAEAEGRGCAYLYLGSAEPKGYCYGSVTGRDTGDIRGYAMHMGANAVTVGDINNDGKDEFAVGNYFGDTLQAIWICKYYGPSGVEQVPDDRLHMSGIRLGQNYPNPFRQSTVIRYQATGDGPVNLSVYNIAGQLVRTLVNETSPSCPSPNAFGEGRVRWDGRDDDGRAVPNGVYFYRLANGGNVLTKKLIIVK